MAEEMRVIPLDAESVETMIVDAGNIHLEIKNGMVLYNKAASRIVVNGVVLLDVPKRTRAKKVDSPNENGSPVKETTEVISNGEKKKK